MLCYEQAKLARSVAGDIPSRWPKGIVGNQVPLGCPPPGGWAFHGGGTEVAENSMAPSARTKPCRPRSAR
jgi:hypothetical protein